MTKSTPKSFNAPWLQPVQCTRTHVQCSSEACLTKKHILQVTAKYHQTHRFHIARAKMFAADLLNTQCCLCVCAQSNQLNNALTKAYDQLWSFVGTLVIILSSSFLFLSVQRIVAHAFFCAFLVSFSAGFSWSGSWSGVLMMLPTAAATFNQTPDTVARLQLHIEVPPPQFVAFWQTLTRMANHMLIVLTAHTHTDFYTGA